MVSSIKRNDTTGTVMKKEQIYIKNTFFGLLKYDYLVQQLDCDDIFEITNWLKSILLICSTSTAGSD